MCGATLLSEPARPETRAVRTPAAVPSAAATTVSHAPEPPRPETHDTNDHASISGPSFLGLNDPPPRKRASLSIDPHSAHGSRNLDYLLDDEESHPSGGG